jgi:hypothetical protein
VGKAAGDDGRDGRGERRVATGASESECGGRDLQDGGKSVSTWVDKVTFKAFEIGKAQAMESAHYRFILKVKRGSDVELVG